MQAHTAEDKAEAIEQAVDRMNCTRDWLSGQTFLTSAQMEQWSGLVSACIAASSFVCKIYDTVNKHISLRAIHTGCRLVTYPLHLCKDSSACVCDSEQSLW